MPVNDGGTIKVPGGMDFNGGTGDTHYHIKAEGDSSIFSSSSAVSSQALTYCRGLPK